MATFSTSSLRHRETLHPKLQEVLDLAIQMYDYKIVSGYRGQGEQNRLHELDLSKVRYPNSKHNKSPSLAVDITPYPINWEDKERFYFLAGVIFSCAFILGVTLRWGGDWDRDTDLHDQKFMDLGHFEIILEEETT